MILPGRLRLTTLGDLLGAMHRGGAAGVLELTELRGVHAGRLHRIHLADGLVEGIESPLLEGRDARDSASRLACLDSLCRLGDARVSFRVRRPGTPGARPLSPSEFLHGRRRRREQPQPTRDGEGPPEPPQVADRAGACRTLGLPPGATAADARRAFRRLAAELHPDRHTSADPESRGALLQRFAQITAAYHALVA